MQLTGKEIVQEEIITNYDSENAVQQQGIDVRLMRVNKFAGNGHIPAFGKTILPKYEEIVPEIHVDTYGLEHSIWFLPKGYYEVVMMEGCKTPANRVFDLKSRSSLVRCGAQIVCGQFDGGFETDHMGCFLRVDNPEGISIEMGARVAQVRVHQSSDVENLYNGQFQNDKQRTS